jgi:glycine/D-amino acid oxidase-like deaminating enzyme
MTGESFRDKSFWLGTKEYEPGPALRGRQEADVAIVGGGFTGLSAAHFLKEEEPGLKIALLEGRVIGYGASGRNGGFSMTLFGLTLGLTARRFGLVKAKEAHHYMERAVDMLRDLIGRHGIDCDYEHPGFLRVATSGPQRDRILREIDLADTLGLAGIEWMDQARLSEQVKSPLYLGAWWEPRCGLLNPAKLAWGWKEVTRRQGVEIFEQTPAVEIRREAKGRIRLLAPWGEVVAKKLLLATNAYSHLVPQLKRKQAPVWTYIVLTEPLGERHFRQIGWKNRQGIEDARDLVRYYRLTADNRLLMGGRDVAIAFGSDMDRDRNEEIFIGLERDVRTIFPALKDIHFTHYWGGPVSVPVDLAPALGYLGNRDTVYSLGCVGHGVSMTHLNGKTCADLLLGRRTELTDMFFVNRTTLPWPPEPFRFLASRAVTEFMRREDRKYDAVG